MKHGKKPTVKQLGFIAQFVADPSEWLVCKNTDTEMVIQHRVTGDLKHLQKWGYSNE